MNRTKLSMILEAFQNGDKLTHLKALAFRTHRLAHFVNVLRQRGWNIISTVKCDGTGTQFTEYFLCQLEPRKFHITTDVKRHLIPMDLTSRGISATAASRVTRTNPLFG